MHQGTVPPDMKRCVYMYRKTQDGIPNFEGAEIADLEMPAYFHFGTSTGNFLNSIAFLSKQVFASLLAKSFVEPTLKSTRPESNRNSSSDKQEFKRPSDFRKISLTLRKATQQSLFSDASLGITLGLESDSQDSKNPIREGLVHDVMALVSALNW
nr:uncharacterized protein LOC111512420 [Leptinotarsa decemlineata]